MKILEFRKIFDWKPIIVVYTFKSDIQYISMYTLEAWKIFDWWIVIEVQEIYPTHLNNTLHHIKIYSNWTHTFFIYETTLYKKPAPHNTDSFVYGLRNYEVSHWIKHSIHVHVGLYSMINMPTRIYVFWMYWAASMCFRQSQLWFKEKLGAWIVTIFFLKAI